MRLLRVLFPRTLCGVLAFDSLSRASSASASRPASFQQPSHTPSLTHIFVNHHLSHTIFHTHLCQQQSFTHHLLHTPSFTHHLSHTNLATSTSTLRGRRGTYGTGLALVARLGPFWSPVTPRHFAWQAWRLWHWAGSGGALGPVLVAGDAAALCVAGVALGDIHLRFTWQAWHLAT